MRLQSAVSLDYPTEFLHSTKFLATVNLSAIDSRHWAGAILLLDKPFTSTCTFP